MSIYQVKGGTGHRGKNCAIQVRMSEINIVISCVLKYFCFLSIYYKFSGFLCDFYLFQLYFYFIFYSLQTFFILEVQPMHTLF